MLKFLLTSDLHLTSRPKDRYRLGILSWLRKQAKKNKVDAVIILGDLTEFKDEHDSILVNYMVTELANLAAEVPTYVLCGNHDCTDPNNPFFAFVNNIENLEFIYGRASPVFILSATQESHEVVFLPHTRDPEKAWAAHLKQKGFDNAEYLFLHQTFHGAVAETGKKLSGASFKELRGLKAEIYSGDIHVPQKVGPVRYVGAPYNVRFGDEYKPRVLLVNDKKRTNLYYPAPRKWKVTMTSALVPDKKEMKPGDFVRVLLQLEKHEVEDWAEYRRKAQSVCEELGLELNGIELEVTEHEQTDNTETEEVELADRELDITDWSGLFDDYCSRQNVAERTRDVGRGLLESYTSGD